MIKIWKNGFICAIALLILATMHGEGQEIKLQELPKNSDLIDLVGSIDEKSIAEIEIKQKYDKNGEISCLQMAKDLFLKVLPAFNVCMKEMQLDAGKLRSQLRTSLPCLVKCMGKKLNILTPDGMFNQEYAKSFIFQNFPPRFLEHVSKLWDSCTKFVHELVVDDPTCKSYKPLIKCGVDVGLEIAAEAIQLCPDIPDIFKKAARDRIKSKKTKQDLEDVIGLDGPKETNGTM